MSDRTEYVKYVTQKFVSYLDKSPEAVMSRQQRKLQREHWTTRWFGVVPLGVRMWVGGFGKLNVRKYIQSRVKGESSISDLTIERPIRQ